jgi:SWI/SNF-related matrix-associated actin-dependent regulator 1 of chromatin subfamily A
MKMRQAILGVTVCAALALVSGCSKEEPSAGETPKATAESASGADTAKAVAEAASQAAGEAQKAAQAAATQAVVEAADAAAAATAQAQALIDKAKNLVTDQKYQEALPVVQQLSNLKLTPEQQKLVDGLKAQIQAGLAKATAPDAASAAGNVLGGKK